MVVWSAPPREFDLTDEEIHIWRASLDCALHTLQRFEMTLSADERERTNRFRFSRDRESFVAARGGLRELLGRYLKKPPSTVRFEYANEGKPSVSREDEDWPIRFNLSHTGRTALYALARGREVGIDVENIRSDVPAEGTLFSAEEAEELGALPGELRGEAFFNCWTRKEAYVKARGGGLQIPLDSFAVALTPGAPARFVRGVDQRWNLLAFTPAPNCVAALAFDGSPCAVRFFDLLW